MTIFEQHQRVDLDVVLHCETVFEYLNRSARPEMGLVRDVLEAWFSRYPDRPGISTREGAKLRSKLLGELRSRRGRQQMAAFWELYLHESLVRAGCCVTVRADTPDFDVMYDGRRFQLEATVRGPSDGDVSTDNRINMLRDGLDRMSAGRWSLGLSVSVESTSSPPIAALRGGIEAWLRTLDVDAVGAELVRGPASESYGHLPAKEFERDGWTVHVRAIPKKDGVQRSGRQPASGVWEGAVVGINNAEGVVESLRQKARRLQRIDSEVPQIVAVLLDRQFADEEDVEQALFGSEGIRFTRRADGSINDAQPVRTNDGFWSDEHRAGRRVDAVLSATRLDQCTVSRCTPLLWTNPWTSRSPIEVPSSLPWEPRWFDGQGKKQRRSPPTPDAFFGLPPRWPEV